MQAFLQPKNALQRAHELALVGQKEEAFDTLHRTITDRKFRYVQWDPTQQEEVVTAYAKLGVDLDRVKSVREGLLQYRNHCQHTVSQIGPLVRVLHVFRKRAEDKLTEAEAAKSQESDATNAETATTMGVSSDGEIELGAFDSAEALNLAAMTVNSWNDAARECDRCLRLTLDVYRTVMDIIKMTPKLQKTYHETAHRAFDFCRNYSKPSDFRRLCELVRNNYTAIMKLRPKSEFDLANKAELEELRRPELHIETRLSQLKNAAALNLWKEAMQTIEDLFSLGIIELASKKVQFKGKSANSLQLRQLMLMSLAAYYEKLAEVFDRSGYRALHALALMKWLAHTRQHNKSFSADEYCYWASVTVLAVLAVPVVRGPEVRNGPRYEEEKRLTTLLGHPSVPTRHSLVAALRDRSILVASFPCVQEFFEVVEGQDFLPLTAVGRVQPLFAQITERLASVDNASLKEDADVTVDPSTSVNLRRRATEYIGLLRETVFRKLLIKLSGVYSTISIGFFRSKICPEEFLPWCKAEHALVALVDECHLELRLDYVDGVIRLAERSDEDPHGVVAERVAHLSAALLKIVSPSPCVQAVVIQNIKAEQRSQLAAEAAAGLRRLALLDVRRTELERLQKRRDENLEEMAKERAKKETEMEAEKQRLLAEERAQAKKKEEAELARLECATQLLKKMRSVTMPAGATPHQFLICGSPLASLTPQSLISRQVTFRDFEQALDEYQSKIRQELIKQKKIEHKRRDHLARAIRLEESTAITKWAESIKARDDEKLKHLVARKIQEREAELESIAVRKELLRDCVHAIKKWGGFDT